MEPTEPEKYVWCSMIDIMKNSNIPPRPEDEAEVYEEARSMLLSERKDIEITKKTKRREVKVEMYTKYPNSVDVKCIPPHLDGSDCYCEMVQYFNRHTIKDYYEAVAQSKSVRERIKETTPDNTTWCQIL